MVPCASQCVYQQTDTRKHTYVHDKYISTRCSPFQFIVLLIQGSQVLIVHCSDCTETDSYQAVVYSLLGRVWLVFVNVLIIIQDMGACATYLIIIADQVDKGETWCNWKYASQWASVYKIWYNTVWPLWQLRCGSTLAGVMGCCLTAPSYYYLNHCRLLNSDVLWSSYEINFTASVQATIL